MKFILETHTNAPELNKIHFNNGATMNTPGLTTIKDVKDFYFKKPTEYKKSAVIVTTYPTEFKSLNDIQGGYFTRYGQVIEVLSKIKARLIKPTDLNHLNKPFGIEGLATVTNVKGGWV